ncbi:hypothetical protein SELMODRAFT_75308 [Selaginella moellendorffii]|uniref:Small ribosomal subunit protein uS13m n=2 Tax=Selaginella moellendorffii TaxID=88036 RepID=D8QR07_SELML|nr:hypothetical protein SELMODRAFT_87518 [Selaginella moellendorffii]EFJ38540.1 hypothetical protein SELMODRAFT_75308 [Selaginella moellendorffii]
MNKAVKFALPRIYGVGRRKAAEICAVFGIGDDVKMNSVPDELFNRMMNYIHENHLVEKELALSVQMDIKRLISIGSYRGYRHTVGLPLRGQRTHTNAMSARITELEKLKKILR